MKKQQHLSTKNASLSKFRVEKKNEGQRNKVVNFSLIKLYIANLSGATMPFN